MQRNIPLVTLVSLMTLSANSTAGVWQDFKLNRLDKTVTSVKSLILGMEQKKVGVNIFQKEGVIILATKHSKMKWDRLEKSLVPHIRIGCEREGGVMTDHGLKETMNTRVINDVYAGSIDPTDILRYRGKLKDTDFERFKKKAYNSAKQYAQKQLGKKDLIAVMQVDARYCVRKNNLVNGIFFFIDRNEVTHKIQNLYTLYIEQPNLMAVIRPGYKSALFAPYKYTRKLQNSVSYYDGRFDSKRGVDQVNLEVNGSDEYVLHVNYRNHGGFVKTIKLSDKKFIKMDGDSRYPMMSNIQESGETDLRVNGRGCTIDDARLLQMQANAHCTLTVSVIVPGFRPAMNPISFIEGDHEYRLAPISQYIDKQ